MVDIVKASVLQRNSTELGWDTELKLDSDFLSSKGFSFEGIETYLMEKIGGVIKNTIPNFSFKMTYSSNLLTVIEAFNGFTKTTANRIARWGMTYTGHNLTSEELKIYSLADGTTVLRTITTVYTYSGNDVESFEVTES